MTSTFVARTRGPSCCLPLVKQGRLIAVLYLENNLAANVLLRRELRCYMYSSRRQRFRSKIAVCIVSSRNAKRRSGVLWTPILSGVDLES